MDNPNEAKNAIKYSKYPPVGERGISPWFAPALGVPMEDVIEKANDETILILQMESASSLVSRHHTKDNILNIKNQNKP